MPGSSPPRVEADPSGAAWSLHGAGTRLEVRFEDGTLVCDGFAPEVRTRHRTPRPAPLVRAGPGATPVLWRRHHWEIPAPGRLAVTLLADDPPLACTVTFEIDPATGVLRRATELRNLGAATIEIRAAASLQLTLHGAVAHATYLAGDWGAEAQTRTQPPGRRVLRLASRAGKTGFAFQPWLAVRTREATWLCELAWSGNWRLDARLGRTSATLSAGLNPWRLRHRLAPGESLELPDALLACVPGEAEAATHRLHDWRRARRPDPARPVAVQFNTWFACGDTPDEARLAALIPQAARLGCEVFVLDAGWFASAGGDPDEDWYPRVGDWLVDRRRFPAGLRALREACARAGMGFGLWCEPESVGPRARLRQTHPCWLHHPHGHAPKPGGRALLHLGVPEAWTHAHHLLCGLIRESGATWLKWDFNADLAAGWAPGLPAALTAQDPLIAHVRGLYRLQDALRAAFPELVLEMCASGGGRMDAAILARAHTNWISDQPQALAKLAIHFGIQRAHPAVSCNDWLVDWPLRAYPGVPDIDRRGDLAFRLRVAMLGSFGLSAPLDAWTQPERTLAARHVALYRTRLRPLIADGDQYQLTPAPPFDGHGDWAAMWFAAKNGSAGVLFAFRLEGAAERTFPLPGLRAGPRHLRGDHATLTGGGLRVALPAPFTCTLVVVEVG